MYLLPNRRLFNGSQILQGRKKHMPVFWTTNIFYKVAKLVAQCRQDFVLIFNGVWYGSCVLEFI